MAYTLTKEDILLVARDMTAADLADAVWADLIAEVQVEVHANGWGTDERAAMGAKYLGAHKATLRKRSAHGGSGAAAAGPLIGVTVGKISKQYAAPVAISGGLAGDQSLNATSHGIEFVRLRRLFGRRMAVT